MTFDQFANQGGTAAWDSDEAAATKKAADKIFTTDDTDDTGTSDSGTGTGTGTTDADGSDTSGDKTIGTDGDEDAPKHDPNQPGEVPDPDITLDV